MLQRHPESPLVKDDNRLIAIDAREGAAQARVERGQHGQDAFEVPASHFGIPVGIIVEAYPVAQPKLQPDFSRFFRTVKLPRFDERRSRSPDAGGIGLPEDPRIVERTDNG